MHPSVAVVLTLSIALALTSSINAMAITERWICSECVGPEECDQDPPSVCIWGEAKNACGRRICAKGPGERCGGSLNVLGVCGEGMMCRADERCHGCSMQTLECSHN